MKQGQALKLFPLSCRLDNSSNEGANKIYPTSFLIGMK